MAVTFPTEYIKIFNKGKNMKYIHDFIEDSPVTKGARDI